MPHQIDPSTFPAITVGQDVTDWNHAIAGPGAQEVVMAMAENLELENQALLRRDPSILPAVDHGDRLDEMQARLRDAVAMGTTTVNHYRFDSIAMRLITPFGKQDGLSLGLDGTGTMTEETYDANGTRLSTSRGAVRARRSWSAGRPATAGSTWRCCRRLTGADPTRRLDHAVPSGTMPFGATAPAR